MKQYQKLLTLLIFSLVLSACEQSAEQIANDPAGAETDTADSATNQYQLDTIAVSKYGEISLSAVEAQLAWQRSAVCRKIRQNQSADTGLVEACYRYLAEEMVLQEALIEQAINTDDAISNRDALFAKALQQYLDDNSSLKESLVLQPFQQQLSQDINVSEQEIASYYQQHSDQFKRPATALLFNLYRRHQQPENVQATLDFLNQLKTRLLQGESFEKLAREHSHSESRTEGGRVRVVKQGELDPKLETVVFALAHGEVSEPILVHGGALLLMAKNIQPAYTLSLEDSLAGIEAQLKRDKLEQLSEQILATVKLPDNAMILPSEQLLAALDDQDLKKSILKIGSFNMTVEQLRTLVRLKPQQGANDLDEKQKAELYKVYQARANNHRLYLYAEAQQTEVQKNLINARLTQYQEPALKAYFKDHLQQQLDQQIAQDQNTLQRYYQDNKSSFMSPLSYKLSLWDLPLNEQPVEQMAKMEALQQKLSTTDYNLQQAVAELGGSITSWDAQSFKELSKQLPTKAINLLTKANSDNYITPYHLDKALHLIWLERRDEPRQLAYEEAQADIIEAYGKRFGKPLYNDLKQQYLVSSEFEFMSQRFQRMWAE